MPGTGALDDELPDEEGGDSTSGLDGEGEEEEEEGAPPAWHNLSADNSRQAPYSIFTRKHDETHCGRGPVCAGRAGPVA